MSLAFIPVPPFSGFDLGFTEVRIYGVLIATAVLVAATWTRKRYESYGGDGELADKVTIWAVVIAFIGARLAYIVPRIGRFSDDPLSVFQIWEGGIALFGGLTFGLLTLIVLVRRWGGNFPAFMDGLAPALPLAQAIGRWGNYFNQELYGRPTDVPWAVVIEPGNRVDPYQQFSTFHPTFLYESLANLVLVAVILRLERTGRFRRGSLIMVYAIGYGIIRFMLELLRTDTTFRILGLSRNAWVSVVFVLVGAALLRWWQGRPAGSDVGLRHEGDATATPTESDVLVSASDPQDQDGADRRQDQGAQDQAQGGGDTV